MAKIKTGDNRTVAQKKKDFLKAMEKNAGIITDSCKATKIARTLIYKWKKEDKEFAEAVFDINEISIDIAESSLFHQIKEYNTAATIFFLKTRGKKRGYTENDNGQTESPITVNIIGMPEDAI